MQEIKMIFTYLKGTFEFGLWYPTGKDFTMTTYKDVDWEGSVDDRKRTNGKAFFFGNNLVSWLNKKQSSIYLSIIEA
jgi:hypothetical protein